jgi:hypothetical protein
MVNGFWGNLCYLGNNFSIFFKDPLRMSSSIKQAMRWLGFATSHKVFEQTLKAIMQTLKSDHNEMRNVCQVVSFIEQQL